MASVTVDSELMTQHVAAVPVPNSSRSFTVRDEDGAPLLFSLGNNGILFAFKENESGARVRLNLNMAFGIEKKQVVTFSVVQEMVTDLLYYCLAYLKDAEAGETALAFCRPFSPLVLDTAKPFNLTHLMIRDTPAPTIHVSNLLLVRCSSWHILR